MEQRPLGRTGRTVSAVGLGCVTFGREIDEDASYRVLDDAVEKGITLFDTAEGYGGGNARISRQQRLGVDDVREVSDEMGSSECTLGRWLRLRGCREQVSICTKVSSGNSPENIHRALATSLERLGTDHVDLYLLHKSDPEVPMGETLSALTDEVRAGRISIVGCSNFSAAQLRNALAVSQARGYARFSVLQPPYSLAAPQAAHDLFPLCKQEQVAITTYSPLAAGFLMGKYTSNRSQFPEGSRFHILPGHADIYFSERNFRMVERLRKKSEELGLPMVQLAMAWAMAHPDVTSVLIGARHAGHIDNALAAFDMKLNPDLRAEMASWGGGEVK